MTEATADDQFGQFITSFLGLGKEYHHMLEKIGFLIGTVLDVKASYVEKVDMPLGIPSIKFMGAKDAILPLTIFLPGMEGKIPRHQKVLYNGLQTTNPCA